MTDNTLKPFELLEDIFLEPDHLSGTKIHKHIRGYTGFQHARIDEENRVLAFEAIWYEFMKFVEPCLSEIPKSHKEYRFQYMSAFDMPIALMPDGSEIICTKTLPQTSTENSLFFIWINKEGTRYV